MISFRNRYFNISTHAYSGAFSRAPYEWRITLNILVFDWNSYYPKDDATLYNIALVLYRLGEYQMAYKYINEISSLSEKATELMDKILNQISAVK